MITFHCSLPFKLQIRFMLWRKASFKGTYKMEWV